MPATSSPDGVTRAPAPCCAAARCRGPAARAHRPRDTTARRVVEARPQAAVHWSAAGHERGVERRIASTELGHLVGVERWPRLAVRARGSTGHTQVAPGATVARHMVDRPRANQQAAAQQQHARQHSSRVRRRHDRPTDQRAAAIYAGSGWRALGRRNLGSSSTSPVAMSKSTCAAVVSSVGNMPMTSLDGRNGRGVAGR